MSKNFNNDVGDATEFFFSTNNKDDDNKSKKNNKAKIKPTVKTSSKQKNILDEARSEKNDRKILILTTPSKHNELKRISKEENISINKLINISIDKLIQELK